MYYAERVRAIRVRAMPVLSIVFLLIWFLVVKMLKIIKLFSIAVAFSLLSACAGNRVPLDGEGYQKEFLSLDERVSQLHASEFHDEAMAVLQDFAKRYPERKEPWLRAAKIYFERKSYAEAIVAAEEVLQRDASDRTAKSIRVVSGLRVATQSLQELRDDIELKNGAKADAASLAKVMREMLGEDVLVPENEKQRPARPMPRIKKSPAPAPAKPATGGNPFNSLK